jgi:hypothetical protein
MPRDGGDRFGRADAQRTIGDEASRRAAKLREPKSRLPYDPVRDGRCGGHASQVAGARRRSDGG